MECFATGLQVFLSTIKLGYFLHKQPTFTKICRKAESHEIIESSKTTSSSLQQKFNEILDKNWRNSILQSYVFIMSTTLVIGYYFFNALFRNIYNDLRKPDNYTLIFPLPTYFPGWKDHESPYYEIKFIVVGISDYVGGIAQGCFDCYYIVLVLHAVSLYEILELKILEFKNLSPASDRLAYLKDCIEFQEKTFEFYSEVNDIYSKMGLVQLLSTMAVNGVAILQASVGWQNDKLRFMRMSNYIASVVYQLGVYCFNGQALTDQSEKIHLAWYSINWYQESKDLKLLIYMMIIRSNRTIHMRATGFAFMARSTFMSVGCMQWINETYFSINLISYRS